MTHTTKVTQMKGRNGDVVKYQFILTTSEGEFFQSYNSVIAFKPINGKIQLDKSTWDYSTTTGKYRNLFLGEDKKATEKKIAAGEYLLTDLN